MARDPSSGVKWACCWAQSSLVCLCRTVSKDFLLAIRPINPEWRSSRFTVDVKALTLCSTDHLCLSWRLTAVGLPADIRTKSLSSLTELSLGRPERPLSSTVYVARYLANVIWTVLRSTLKRSTNWLIEKCASSCRAIICIFWTSDKRTIMQEMQTISEIKAVVIKLGK